MINGRKRVVMPGFRKVIEEDDVMPNEKRKTRGVSEGHLTALLLGE